LQAIDTRNASRLWKFDTPLNNSKYFSAICASSGMVYVGFYEGFFQGFNEKGERFFSTKNLEDLNYFPEKIFRSTNGIVTFERHKGENKKRLKSYYLNGNAHQEMYIDFEPVAILSKEANTCFVLANKDDKATIYVYDIEANSYYIPTLISGKIICGAKAENKVVYCDNNSILVYDDATNSLTLLKNNFVAEKLEYDITTNELIALQNGVVYLIDFSTGNIKKSIAVNSNASDILLQLSK
jgi:outer membrane protein assembly factor BamB